MLLCHNIPWVCCTNVVMASHYCWYGSIYDMVLTQWCQYNTVCIWWCCRVKYWIAELLSHSMWYTVYFSIFGWWYDLINNDVLSRVVLEWCRRVFMRASVTIMVVVSCNFWYNISWCIGCTYFMRSAIKTQAATGNNSRGNIYILILMCMLSPPLPLMHFLKHACAVWLDMSLYGYKFMKITSHKWFMSINLAHWLTGKSTEVADSMEGEGSS